MPRGKPGAPPAPCHPDRPHKARGLCGRCYHRLRRAGNYGHRERDAFNAWRRSKPEYFMWHYARTRARKHGVPFTIAKSDIVIPERCPVLDIPLVMGVGGTHDGSPSLDRIRPELGYVPGNVAVISHRANTIKNNGSAAELRRVADWLAAQ